MDAVDISGAIATWLGLAGWVPANLKAWRTGSAGDYSWSSMGLTAACQVTFVYFDLYKGSPAMIAGQLFSLANMLVLAFVKLGGRNGTRRVQLLSRPRPRCIQGSAFPRVERTASETVAPPAETAVQSAPVCVSPPEPLL